MRSLSENGSVAYFVERPTNCGDLYSDRKGGPQSCSNLFSDNQLQVACADLDLQTSNSAVLVWWG